MNRKPFKKQGDPEKPVSSNDSFFVQPTVAEKIRKERQKEKEEKRKRPGDKFFVKAQKRGKQLKEAKDEIRHTQNSDETVEKPKKPFDKKQWRLQKYSNKYKVEEWENRRKKFMERRYNKELKKQQQQPSFDVRKIYEEVDEEEGNTVEAEETKEEREEPDVANKRKRGMSYAERIEQLKEDKEKRRIEMEKKREERKAALEAYKRKKKEKNRILSKKTKRGQPIMKGRLELLLQQIEESVAKN